LLVVGERVPGRPALRPDEPRPLAREPRLEGDGVVRELRAPLSRRSAGGTALYCTAHNGHVLGRIDDENPANSDEDCGATMSYRPGYPLPMGATRNSRKVMSIAATAPITKGLGLVVRRSGNPFNSACESPTFSSPDPGKRYFISIFTGWGSGPRREHWTGTAQPGLGLARTTATFDGELDIGIWSGVPNRSVGEQILLAVKDMLAGWWTSLADGFSSS